MKFLTVTQESLEMGANILKEGGLIAFPTETVYGLGADAFNPLALAKIFDVKKRPHFDPLIIHIAFINSLENVADFSLINKETRKTVFLLAENFWPGPLSIVLPKNERIPGIATAGLSTAAIRFPDNEAAQKLISLSGTAVAAPSANLFSSLSPTRAEHVRDSLGEKIDMILDGGPARIGVESTVLDITGDKIKILRPGGTPREAIENLIGPVDGSCIIEQGAEKFTSPGQMKSHYAPKTPLYVLKSDDIIRRPYDDTSVFLFFDGLTRNAWRDAQTKTQMLPDAVKVLSESGHMSEAASCLFETLHELDNLNVSRIFAQEAPQTGLGEAINDRLKRGAEKNQNMNHSL
ncbi:MAG: L-threonylcarbamoyladenylate synthase [Treponema sp.]|nr:L-threonylcarbamoyladenylate synthase [Treponema sp.]